MTVAELIETLRVFEPDLPVALEGCDGCVGPSNGEVYLKDIQGYNFITHKWGCRDLHVVIGRLV